ncbi:hypothetical protein M2324_003765 [Rhodovulum sulfidophilum]|uniref:Uncharacterized protein n=2 Tax=Rhodovulum sulfidophilum TaxID=35806 RepID=A0ABS1RZK6_RHOSU|nr:hypothetical protein [Rhodovulum sulfidophilum]ANB34700.1 hypothetical protein A6W98_11885 [Rhodovulum sulfidophilum DSM 1374]ANB38522.1 hypothetical protein A6024_11750 [Rhodovulum sulfidophilum]MBL3611368.1 hypothetical protein [Rhodovulum sulfidophilum]MCW2305343.1 hypothetical protein [Rhodovulum sulfidophilum]
MSIRAIKGKGVNRARVVCDGCGREEVVTCNYLHRPGRVWVPDAGQINRKMIGQGWAEVKGKLHCPACEAKRKATGMAKTTTAPASNPDGALRQPTRAQKREIMDLLEGVYDTTAERYRQGDTDATVAEVLGVMPGWVAEIRDAFFGPDGGNEDIAGALGRMEALERDMRAVAEEAARQRAAAEKKLAELSVLKVELDRIRLAVGPRALRKAGVAA